MVLRMIGKIAGKEYLFASVLKYCEDIITVKDLNLRYIAHNDSFLKLMGKKTNFSFVGMHMRDVISQHSSEVIEENLKDVIETLQTKSYVFHVNTERINKIIKQTSTPIIHEGKLEGILSISYDVTYEENLRAKLIEKNFQLRTLIENLPMLVYMKDKNRKLTVSTKASKDFVFNGYDKFAEGVQLDMDYSADNTENEDKFVLEHKELLVKEKSARDVNGKSHWYRIYKAPIIAPKQEACGLVTIAMNIDKEKQAENQKNLFLAALTHDLKNPLQAQISTLEMLNKGMFGDLNETQKEMLDMVIESSEYMRSMLHSLLQSCKDNNGVIFLHKNKFDIENLVKKCVKEVKNWGLSKGVNIKFSGLKSSDNKLFYADEHQMCRVIGNIMNNSVNYAYDDTDVIVKLNKTDDKIVLSVTNTSDEISQDLADIIFDKYVCGNNLQSNINVGLGLYFCKKVVNAHQGEISLLAEKNKNTFLIELPFVDENTSFIQEVVL